MIDALFVECLAWWQALGGDFRFLLALPFVVGCAGWLADGRRRDR